MKGQVLCLAKLWFNREKRMSLAGASGAWSSGNIRIGTKIPWKAFLNHYTLKCFANARDCTTDVTNNDIVIVLLHVGL